ncbi:glutamate receptor ionotropic, kainate 1-like [Bactrocera tryoni]|uniref:glutamate receptor ionotropic, kainate 1-like n=1 Tax=Bactrocera tryoni TaxID=59916 RepID=UPI001A96C2E2|nr:glutamate receptor ionotropic, kainate 1-like [Bactrocera tryoni]
MVFLQEFTKCHVVFITTPSLIMKDNMETISLKQIRLNSNPKLNNYVCFNLRSFVGYESLLSRRKLSVSHILLIYYLCNFLCAASLPAVIPLGAIFTEDQRDSSIEYAFKYAVYRINKDKLLLSNTQLIYDIEYAARDDSFRTTKKICRQLESGVHVIFGPSDALLSDHVQSICTSFGIPHIESRIDLDENTKELSINLYPSQRLMNLAHRDLMIFLNWTKTAVLYEDNLGIFNHQDLLHVTADIRTELYIRQTSPKTYRQVLRAIRMKDIYKIIVDTNPTNINAFFRAILQLQMNDHRYHYMFTTFRSKWTWTCLPYQHQLCGRHPTWHVLGLFPRPAQPMLVHRPPLLVMAHEQPHQRYLHKPNRVALCTRYFTVPHDAMQVGQLPRADQCRQTGRNDSEALLRILSPVHGIRNALQRLGTIRKGNNIAIPLGLAT